MIKPDLESLEVPHSSLDPLIGLFGSDLQSFFSVAVSQFHVYYSRANSWTRQRLAASEAVGRQLPDSQALHVGVALTIFTCPLLISFVVISYLNCDVVLASCLSFAFQIVEAKENILIGVFEEEAVHCGGDLFLIHHASIVGPACGQVNGPAPRCESGLGPQTCLTFEGGL